MSNDKSTESPPILFAPFRLRAIAYFLDGLILLPLSLLALYNIIYLKIYAIDLGVGLISLFYKPVLESLYSATLGKKLLKLKVTNTQMKPISTDEALKRYVFEFAMGLSWMIVSFQLFQDEGFLDIQNWEDYSSFQMMGTQVSDIVGMIWMGAIMWIIFDEKKQGLHDKIASTYVILDPEAVKVVKQS